MIVGMWGFIWHSLSITALDDRVDELEFFGCSLITPLTKFGVLWGYSWHSLETLLVKVAMFGFFGNLYSSSFVLFLELFKLSVHFLATPLKNLNKFSGNHHIFTYVTFGSLSETSKWKGSLMLTN